MSTSHKLRSKDPLEVRRARGEISCAECRRHKLRCDKEIPCSTCIRKGCPEICPNGTLTPGQVTRRVSTESDIRQQKIVEMAKRIRQLEDSLQTSHSLISSETHPLLVKSEDEAPQIKRESDEFDFDDTVDTHGTLAVLGRGIESYVGTDAMVIKRFGNADTLHLVLKHNPNRQSPVSHLGDSFPFAPAFLPVQEVQVMIEDRLPTFERASALVEAYLENLSWMFRPVDREQVWEELIPVVYRKRRFGSKDTSDQTIPTDPHILSLMLGIFAIGAIADLTQPPWNEEAELYYHLSRTAISLKPVFDGVNLTAVQALATLVMFDVVACRKNSLEGTWKMTSLCLSLAASIGLHRDPTHFELSPKLIQRRRQLFWELYFLDMWKSCGSGRPVTFTQLDMDCELPEDKEASLNEDGTELPGLWQIRYRFAKEVMPDVAEKLCGAHALKYSEILSLDQRIRDFRPHHTDTMVGINVSLSGNSIVCLLKNILMVLLKDAVLLVLHRSFFVRALVENPLNPMQSRFGPSFLSTYRSANAILRVVRKHFDTCAHFLLRLWPVWAHLVSASVMFGSVAACGTVSALAPQAFVEFDLALEMLSKARMHPLVNDVMPMLFRLREQACQALVKHGNKIPRSRTILINRPPAKEDEREFNSLSGFGRVLQKRIEGQIGPGRLPVNVSDFLLDGYRQSTTQPVTRSAWDRYTIPFDTVYGTSTGHAGDTPATSASSGHHPLEGDTSSNPYRKGKFRQELQSLDTDGSSLSTSRPAPGTGTLSESLDLSGRHTDLNSAISPERSASCMPSGADVPIVSATSPNANSDTDVLTPRAGSNDAEMFQMETPESIDTPMILDALSVPSPPTAPNNDFDISFNMLASTGDESVLPLLSEELDSEAWRTILQDSRFFGFAAAARNETPERSL